MERQEQQGMIEITEEKIRKFLQRLPNWKAPRPNMAQGYWFKYFTSMHKNLKDNLADCLKVGRVPDWMTKGKTVLIQKDPAKGNDPSNYRPITCLPLAWKILTGIISEETFFLNKDHYYQKSKRAAERDPEELQTCYTSTECYYRRSREEIRIWQWDGLTIEKQMI